MRSTSVRHPFANPDEARLGAEWGPPLAPNPRGAVPEPVAPVPAMQRPRIGFGTRILIECGLAAVLVVALVAWPPITVCRTQERGLGFFVGDSMGRCVRRGIDGRLDEAEQRVRMLARGSGR